MEEEKELNFDEMSDEDKAKMGEELESEPEVDKPDIASLQPKNIGGGGISTVLALRILIESGILLCSPAFIGAFLAGHVVQTTRDDNPGVYGVLGAARLLMYIAMKVPPPPNILPLLGMPKREGGKYTPMNLFAYRHLGTWVSGVEVGLGKDPEDRANHHYIAGDFEDVPYTWEFMSQLYSRPENKKDFGKMVSELSDLNVSERNIDIEPTSGTPKMSDSCREPYNRENWTKIHYPKKTLKEKIKEWWEEQKKKISDPNYKKPEHPQKDLASKFIGEDPKDDSGELLTEITKEFPKNIDFNDEQQMRNYNNTLGISNNKLYLNKCETITPMYPIFPGTRNGKAVNIHPMDVHIMAQPCKITLYAGENKIELAGHIHVAIEVVLRPIGG